MAGLQLRGIVWDAGTRYRLAEDPLEVAPGAAVAVVAPADGAGVLADTVLGLTAPVEGTVWVDGRDVTRSLPDPGVVALVPTGGGLLPHLTVAQNIEFGMVHTGSRAAREAEMRALAHQGQLDGALRLRPHRLSPEQHLRVGVARAMARRPAVLVVEDREGQVSWAPALAVVFALHVAVLIVTDSPRRVRIGAVPGRVTHAVAGEGGVPQGATEP